MEVSLPCINQTALYGESRIELNLFYRFYHVFKDLFGPDLEEYPKLRNALTNLIVHMIAEGDILAGMSKREYYKVLLREDLKEGRFGKKAYETFSQLTRDEQESVLSGILRQYETGSSMDIFKDMVEELIDESIVYQNNDDYHQILIYIGFAETKQLHDRIDFLMHLFLELPYHVELYFGHHFGILGVEVTMQLDEMVLC